jgi:phosphopantetheinyl transferase
MPELRRKTIGRDTVCAIWHITENTDELLSAISLDTAEEGIYNAFVAESRKKQWLAYRLLVRELLKPEKACLDYDPSGKPVFRHQNLHLSVTHTADLAAVIISRTSNVGIDIEMVRPRIMKVTDKFISPEEMKSIVPGNELEQFTLAWCAKEALYKLYGKRNLDFREDIRLALPAAAGMEFDATVSNGDKQSSYHLASERNDDCILVYCLENWK